MNNDHPQHDSKVYPVPGCKECDREVARPIPRCFGDGASTQVVPRKKADDGQ